MQKLEQTVQLFEDHLKTYEEWFERYPLVIRNEAEAIRSMLPIGDLHGIEVGLGTGHLSSLLGLKEGVEPSPSMRQRAIERGLEVMDARAEALPYKDRHFDFVIIGTALHFIERLDKAFSEAFRVLKPGGCLVLGVIDRESKIGHAYQKRRLQSTFYRSAMFYSLSTIEHLVCTAGFRNMEYAQTLFGELDQIKELQQILPGTGSGSYVVIKSIKPINK